MEGFIEDIVVFLLYFIEIGPGFLKNEQLVFISGGKDDFFLVPGVDSNSSALWQSPHLFEGFECVLLNFEQFYGTAPTDADQVTVMGANTQLIGILEAETALSESLVFECIDKEQFAVRFSQH